MSKQEISYGQQHVLLEHELAEDMVFCFECLFKAKTYVIALGGGYVYRMTP